MSWFHFGSSRFQLNLFHKNGYGVNRGVMINQKLQQKLLIYVIIHWQRNRSWKQPSGLYILTYCAYSYYFYSWHCSFSIKRKLVSLMSAFLFSSSFLLTLIRIVPEWTTLDREVRAVTHEYLVSKGIINSPLSTEESTDDQIREHDEL